MNIDALAIVTGFIDAYGQIVMNFAWAIVGFALARYLSMKTKQVKLEMKYLASHNSTNQQ